MSTQPEVTYIHKKSQVKGITLGHVVKPSEGVDEYPLMLDGRDLEIHFPKMLATWVGPSSFILNLRFMTSVRIMLDTIDDVGMKMKVPRGYEWEYSVRRNPNPTGARGRFLSFKVYHPRPPFLPASDVLFTARPILYVDSLNSRYGLRWEAEGVEIKFDPRTEERPIEYVPPADEEAGTESKMMWVVRSADPRKTS